MQPATYASVAHVGWERSIRWEAPDDDDAAERAAPVVGGDARVASGAWTRAIRWDGDQTAAPSDEPTPAPADEDARAARAYREPAGRQSRRRAAGNQRLPKAANARPAQLHRFVSADTANRARELFHRPRVDHRLLRAPWRLAARGRSAAQRGARQLRARSLDQVRAEDLRAGDGDLFVGELSEERPGLVANPGMSFALCRLRRGVEGRASDDDDDRDGVAVDLGMEAPSPLLGDLPEPGRELLVGVSNLQRRPVFPHASRDFLLCLRPRLRKDLGRAAEVAWTCRPLRQHVVAALGQGEPRIEVPPAGSKRYAALQEPLAAFHIARALLAKSSAAKGDVKHATFPASDLGRALFASAPAPLALVKRAAAEVAERVRDVAGEALKSAEGEDLWTHRAQAVRPDDVALRFAPEDVCAYESASASLKRLKHLGLRRPQLLGGPAGVAPACRKLFEVKRAADARARDLEARARGDAAPAPSLGDLAAAARRRCAEADATLRAAMRVHEELSFAPAHLTSGFCDAVLKKTQHAVLRLEGPGDPSGCGDAFSFARSTLRELRRGDVIHKASGQAVREAYDERVNAIARRQRHALSGRGRDGAAVEDDALKDLRGGFVGRGARGPYATSSGYDAAKAQKARDQNKRRKGGSHGRRSPAEADDDLEDLEADLEQDLLQGEAKDEDERQLESFRRALQQESSVQQASGPPRFLVRRLTRRLVHGREVVAVTFVNSSHEVDRVARRTGVSLEADDDALVLDVPLDDRRQAPGPKKLTLRLGAKEEPKKRTGAVKLNLTKLRGRADDYKAEAKRQKAEQQRAEAAAYHRPVAKREGPRADAQNKPHVQLAKLLRQECLNPMYARPGCRPFVRPVSTKAFPAYKTKIAKPMDLSTIKSRLERYVYRDREGFMADMDLIATNSITFNGPEHPISKEALAMARAARAACDSFDDELGALERATKAMMAAAPKRRRASPPPAAAAPAPAPGDGVALAFTGIGRAPVPTNARTPPTSPPPQLAPSGAPVRQASTAPQQPLLRVAAARPAATSSPPPSTPFLAAALADDSSSGEEEAVGGGAIN